jgi:hypothetical protein
MLNRLFTAIVSAFHAGRCLAQKSIQPAKQLTPILLEQDLRAAGGRQAALFRRHALPNAGRALATSGSVAGANSAMRNEGNYSWNSMLLEGYPLFGFVAITTYLLWSLLA